MRSFSCTQEDASFADGDLCRSMYLLMWSYYLVEIKQTKLPSTCLTPRIFNRDKTIQGGNAKSKKDMTYHLLNWDLVNFTNPAKNPQLAT